MEGQHADADSHASHLRCSMESVASLVYYCRLQAVVIDLNSSLWGSSALAIKEDRERA